MSWLARIFYKSRKRPENAKSLQPTENQNNTKYENVSQREPEFTVNLPEGRLPPFPSQLHHHVYLSTKRGLLKVPLEPN